MPRRSVLTGPLVLLAVVAILALALSVVGGHLGDDGAAAQTRLAGAAAGHCADCGTDAP